MPPSQSAIPVPALRRAPGSGSLLAFDDRRPARERRLIAREELVQRRQQLVGQGLAKGTTGQIAAALDAASRVIAGGSRSCACSSAGLRPDQLVLQLPAAQAVEIEGLLIFAEPDRRSRKTTFRRCEKRP
jgi:hypothetical protein